MGAKDVIAAAASAQPPDGFDFGTIPSAAPPWLAATIENELVPRLLLAHRQTAPMAEAEQRIAPSGDEIETLALLAIRDTYLATTRFVDDLRRRGTTAELIFSDLLPGAARHLGWMWEQDTCTFVEVTFGLARLQQVLHLCAPSLRVGQDAFGGGRPALLATMPGEQHSFGLCVVEEWFRRAGWTVETERPRTTADLLRAAQSRAFDVIGLSVSADRSVAQINGVIRALRRNAGNREMKIVVGGCALARCPDIAETISADVVASDGLDGLNRLAKLMHPPFAVL